MTQVFLDTENIVSYNHFISALTKNNLTFADLNTFGLLRKSQIAKIKKIFKGKERSKAEWARFKNCHDIYYFVVRASPDVAHSNKNRKENI